MPASYLTEPEWTAAFAQFGVHETLAYAGVSNTQLSIARHYRGLQVNGRFFYYMAETDELVRHDLFKWLHKRRTDEALAAHRAEEAAARAAQGSMF